MSRSDASMQYHEMLFSSIVLFTCLIGNLLAQLPTEAVNTNYGQVKGLVTDKAKVFRGIPYARPPVKELRWQDPLPPFPWSGILQVTEDPPACPQSPNCSKPKWICPARIQEDCLYLNVFTPLTATNSSRLPVMVFIHGGSFVTGYSGGLLSDGQYIANYSNIILVSINYRLGALGFLVYGSNLEIGGNYGLKDQRFALKWVQENIAYFGGDPSSVTIFGHSAGGISVACHMCSVQSSGLFHKGIIESDAMGLPLKAKSDSLDLGRKFATQIGCGDDNDVACMKEKDVDTIVASEMKFRVDVMDFYRLSDLAFQWTPCVDGVEISDQPLKAFKEGRVASVPVIMGNVRDETYSSVMELFDKSPNEFDYAVLQAAFYGVENYPEVSKKYPFTEGADNRNELSVSCLPKAYVGKRPHNVHHKSVDNPYWCPTRYGAASFANSTGFPVWLYNFDHVASYKPWPPEEDFCNLHVCHGEELAFVFHSAPLFGYKFSAEEETLSNQMITYWTNLAKYGDPNGESDTSWPAYTNQTRNIHFLTPENKVDEYRSEYCDFWDQIGYNV